MGRALTTAYIKPTAYFAMPSPRKLKGKEKASDECPDHLSQCREWSCCASRHSIWCPVSLPHALLREFDEGLGRRKRRAPTQSLPKLSPTGISGGPRRHASHAVRYAQICSAQRPSTVPLDQPDDSVKPKLSRRGARAQLEGLIRGSSEICLDSAWAFYEEAKDSDVLLSLPAARLLSLSKAMLDRLEKSYSHPDLEKNIHAWGSRVKSIIDDVQQCVSEPSNHEYLRSCLRVRALALEGHLPKAAQALQAVKTLQLTASDATNHLISAYEGLILAQEYNSGPLQVLDFLLDEWSDISRFVAPRSASTAAPPSSGVNSLRRSARSALCDIADPISVIAQNPAWDARRRSRAGCLLIEAQCALGLSRQAYRILQVMQQERLFVPVPMMLHLIRCLARDDEFESANLLFTSIPLNTKARYQVCTGLYLYAQQGDPARASSFFEYLRLQNWITSYDIAQLMCSFAVQGRTDEVLRIFTEYFPHDKPEEHKYQLDSHHFVHVLSSYAREGKMCDVDSWLEKMVDSGHPPDVYVYTILMQGFARKGDQESVMRLLDQMQREGVCPTVVTYTTIITLLAHRKDAVGAEAFYRRALQEGIIPDRCMITSMMNAHVEAGSWAGVIRIFDYLKARPQQHLHLTIEVYNTLLKAYVLIGAPFKIVSNIFSSLEGLHVRPDAYTFALLIQSACDAGLMDIASDIFLEVDKLAQEKGPTLMNAYMFTIIMTGFLRTGDKIRAKAVYDDMLDRGIKPTAITFGQILRAYGNERNEGSLEIAEQFVQKLLATPGEERDWDQPSHGRKTALEHVYGPLVNAYAHQQKVEDVERLIQELVDAGRTPSLGVLSALLDVYRRTSDIGGVKRLWPEILQLGLKQSRSQPLFEGDMYDPSRGRLQGNILCLPFSIYIDALSSAGLHAEIPQVCKEFQNHGFKFDSHNWNHLVVALVRGGEIERAFSVVEKVILPYQRMAQRVQPVRDPTPDTPLSFDPLAKENPEDDVTEVPSEPPMHRARQRAVVVGRWTRELFTNTDMASLEHEGDSIHPLQLLHQISPTWNAWKPHAATIAILQYVLTTLRSGRVIYAVGTTLETISSTSEEEDRARRLLATILADYPDTVRVVEDHEIAEKRRLGRDYDSSYKWR
ncbi:hypothetical protein BDN72DRAFT_842094 [Pluteus cervinus]|uniref:Uncharacterized protein n=1 Tax=Pluteus cervinus TaxID=181527 RepID=A0ACD3ARA1_9AGAR|nr:hypothetical protein BDN72DRAFT_842094 [Pluteus cervinus]